LWQGSGVTISEVTRADQVRLLERAADLLENRYALPDVGTRLAEDLREAARGERWVSLAESRSVNPVTGGNWQGTGVRPDVEAPAERALDVATGLARDAIGDQARRAG
jgi:hypothetical protein